MNEPSDRERQRRLCCRMLARQRDDQCRGNADSRRSARARQTVDDRVARRRDDAPLRRSARARLTSDERDAWHQENAERMRTARRGRQDASRPEWAHLWVHARPSPRARAIRLGAAHLCSHCGARLLCGETESLCCGNGRITTTPLPTCASQYLVARRSTGTPSIGTSMTQTREADTRSLDQQLVDAIQQALTNINPYARSLRQLGQEPAEQGPDRARYHVGDSVDQIQDYLQARYVDGCVGVTVHAFSTAGLHPGLILCFCRDCLSVHYTCVTGTDWR